MGLRLSYSSPAIPPSRLSPIAAQGEGGQPSSLLLPAACPAPFAQLTAKVVFLPRNLTVSFPD